MRVALFTVLAALTLAGSANAYTLAEVGTFYRPVQVAAPPGDPHRVLVVQQDGKVPLMRDGTRLGDPFLDVGPYMKTGPEEGLLSLAFAPDYATSGLLYVSYTEALSGDSGGNRLVIDELRRSPSSSDIVDPSSRRRVIAIDHPTCSSHNAGQLQFGPDGYLYATVGDNGFGATCGGGVVSQDMSNLQGKLIRIDPRESSGNPYSVPADNPFVSTAGARAEIWGLGLRNAWRFSFDSQTGALVLTDVGQATWDEIDFAPQSDGGGKGENYGWNCEEGPAPYGSAPPSCSGLTGTTSPVFSRETKDPSPYCAIIGGYVMHDASLPDLAERYVYGDYCVGELRSVRLQRPSATDDTGLGVSVADTSGFGLDSCGHLYATSQDGQVYRLDDGPFTPCGTTAAGTGTTGGPVSGDSPNVDASGAGSGAATADRTRPHITLTRSRLQRVLRARAFVVTVRCDELCGVTATGSMRVHGIHKPFGLKRAARPAAAGTTVRLRLGMSRKALRAAARALRRHRRVTALVRVVARDPAGNATAARIGLRAKR